MCARLCSAFDGRVPSDDVKVVPTKSAPAWLEQPEESRLYSVSHTNTAEIDRFAIWTLHRERPEHSENFHCSNCLPWTSSREQGQTDSVGSVRRHTRALDRSVGYREAGWPP